MTEEPLLKLFTIVVVGDMSPAIHHPWWYRDVGIFDEVRAEEAIAQDLVASPQISFFNLKDLRIECSADRWEVKTTTRDNLDLCVQITGQVFEQLTHTPTRALGFNLHWQRTGSSRRFKEIIDAQLAPYGLDAETPQTFSTAWQRRLEDGSFTTRLDLAYTQRLLQIRLTRHVEISALNLQGHFELAPLLERYLKDLLQRSDEVLSALETAFSPSEPSAPLNTTR